jgi:hypothetical protein
LDVTTAETKTNYNEIRDWIKNKYGFKDKIGLQILIGALFGIGMSVIICYGIYDAISTVCVFVFLV